MMRRLAAAAVLGCLLVIGLAAAPAAAQGRVALVIGNGNYTNATALPNPANDAREMARSLRAIGFDVAQGENLDRVGMERLLLDFLRKAQSASVALLFYAGHGMQVDGRNYLIPVDARLDSASDLNFGTVELDKILASLDDPSRATIIILDACRDNPLARSFATRTRSASVGAGLAAYTALGTGTLIAFSTAPGRVAEDGRGANSPFTQALVKHLPTPGLEVRQMLTRVRAEVAAATGDKQVPWDNSSLRGDVYLAGQGPGGGASPVMPATTSRPAQSDACAGAEAHWRSAEAIATKGVFEDHLKRFPDCAFAGLARARIDGLARAATLTPRDSEPAPSACPGDFAAFRNTGREISCTCAAAAMTGSVWGTTVYTDDSSVCAAARHAGAVGAEGGPVRVRATAGRASYEASTRNGVASGSWNQWHGSFVFTSPAAAVATIDRSPQSSSPATCPSTMKGQGGPLTCQCRPEQMSGTVWGSGTYTDDSSICLAAVHAGVVTRSGGEVRITVLPGQGSYSGSQRHGVTTMKYGRWSSSFRFLN